VQLADLVADTLRERGDASVRELLAAIRAAGGDRVPRSLVERLLAEDPRFEPVGDPAKFRWSLAPEPAAPPAEPSRPETRGQLDRLDLRPWQAQALATWSETCRGVVEAVTGTGKTRLAMAAIRVVVDGGGRALVLVPTLELQDQWARELRTQVPGVRIGRLGGGHDDDLFSHEVVIATPHSAASVPLDLPPGAIGLLVADEAHRYGAPTWGAALQEAFTLRLALTATYERGDDGLEEVLGPYFGEVVTRYGYARAVADGTVAPFRIALAGVRLDPDEREAYDRADARVRQLHRELVGGLGMPKEPRALFAAVAAVVAEADATGRDGPQTRAAREYLVRVRERRDVAATSAGKLRVCQAIAPALAGRRTLAFTDTVEQAEDAVRVFARAGLAAETVHGELAAERRRIRLAVFRRGGLDVVVAPRVLDEGVDVPDADVALVLAAFRSRRQTVQRLGRVLRMKPDGREARLVLAHAVDTREDPARGAHGDFLDDVRAVARSVDPIDVDRDPRALTAWVER
jgi:superfamily II DNA or RNA helicase